MSDQRTRNETIKEASRQLRGMLRDEISRQETGAISEDDGQLLKFHGSYLQDNRDVRAERTKKKLEKAYAFMIRLRIPGGLMTAEQWLRLDSIAKTYANGTLRLTTRETFQYHGVIKSNLKRTMQEINAACLDTLAACGDVNRNVMTAANPYLSKAHKAAYDLGKAISEHLLPKTSAYHEIWLDGEKVEDKSRAAELGEEPLYGVHYLPRKFKCAVAVPPDNDVDVFAQDLGFIAIVDKGHVRGWNVTVGGGMGMTHGDRNTFPRTGDVLGYCRIDQAVDVAEKVLTVQRDWGNRKNRARARLKYTIEDRGLPSFRAEVEKRLGYSLGEAMPFDLTSTGDPIGWRQTCNAPASKALWHLTLLIENGRIKDEPDSALMSALREIANARICDFVATSNQNLILANVRSVDRSRIEDTLRRHNVETTGASGLRRNAMACVALPTCGLALAESERFLPELLSALEDLLDKSGLHDDDIVIRMTGCPNGCARPYLAEIGLVGKGPGRYNLYLGAAFNGTRLSKLYAENIDKNQILSRLEPLFIAYAKMRKSGERFGDFAIRAGYVAATQAGNRFHDDILSA